MSRRLFISGTAAVAGGAAAGISVPDASAGTPLPGTLSDAVVVTPANQQYPDLITGMNQRWVARPEAIHLVSTTEQVVAAVQYAVRAGKRVSLRSGGHCLEDFVYNPSVQVVLDLSGMNQIGFDAARNAFSVEPGATLLEVYEKLYSLWGVVVPGGICYSVGMGGHVAGGGWGLLCRKLGLIVDYLHAVEVVVVDAAGTARAVVATRDPADPHHDLWWAHTGGGGGNFGVVTRYWFRTPGATSRLPGEVLPKPPASVLLSAISWPWAAITPAAFSALLKNYSAYHVANSAPDNPRRALCSFLMVNHKSNGQIGLVTQVDATVPDADRMLEEWLTTMNRGVGVRPGALTTSMGEFSAMPQFAAPRRLPWLQATRFLGTTNPTVNDPTLRADFKSAYMRAVFPDRQIAALYKHFTSNAIDNPQAALVASGFGGAVSSVAAGATAFPHRAAAFKLLWQVWWSDRADDAKTVAWTRESYADVYSDTGAVPVPNAVTDGCYVNYADTDLSNPAFNRSSVPWYTLYYKENYPRLRQVKKRWDPRDVFRHGQSVQLP
ncbi:FAD-binding oxidoreductase [Kibdelosporangium phytohabitans]|uniref:FAD-binding oxidoreductase n=1 Tax=Kibdelosporangium phytohabitans TaxID=860235 RepID=UPI001F4663EC|nr:FAD-binding protein [Kibdelosporangium phytohabitans]